MEYEKIIKDHQHSKIVVCGCGTSLSNFPPHNENVTTIGVNDVGLLFTPDYLVVLNTSGFKGDRWNYVIGTKAKYVFSQYTPDKLKGIDEKKLVKLALKKGSDVNDMKHLDHSNTSPYVGVIIAHQMGAKNIGVIGLDFTEDHFFGKTGRHSLTSGLKNIKEDYRKLVEKLEENGTKLFNLSDVSVIDTVPKLTIDEFLNISEDDKDNGTGDEEKD